MIQRGFISPSSGRARRGLSVTFGKTLILRSHKFAREFGIVIGNKNLWGHGYGSEAIRLAIGYGFKRLKLHRIQLIVLDFNKRARHAYMKVGFVKEGVQREALLVGGRWHDVIMMDMLKSESELRS